MLAGTFLVATPALALDTAPASEQDAVGEIVAPQSEALSPVSEIVLEQDSAARVIPITSPSLLGENPVQAQESLLSASIAALEKANDTSSASTSADDSEGAPTVAVEELFGNEPVLRAAELPAIEEAIRVAAAEKAAAERAAAFAAKIGAMTNGNAGQLTGMYVDNVFAMSIGEFWQFGLASQYGSLGLLAHNYAGGGNYFSLSVGSVIKLVYGDGSTRSYQVVRIRRFEALQPNSPTSQFIDLDKGGGKQSASKVFHQIYNSSNPLVLQTCIANNGISTWGRLFVIAVPIG